MKKLFVTSLVSLLLILFMSGCTKVTNEETGEVKYKLNPIVSKQVEDAVEGGASLLSMVYPPAVAATIPILAALGIWKKKIKPKFEKAQTETNLYHTTTHALVTAIEELKKNNPSDWENLKKELNVGPQVENVIRAIRGLPAKK